MHLATFVVTLIGTTGVLNVVGAFPVILKAGDNCEGQFNTISSCHSASMAIESDYSLLQNIHAMKSVAQSLMLRKVAP